MWSTPWPPAVDAAVRSEKWMLRCRFVSKARLLSQELSFLLLVSRPCRQVRAACSVLADAEPPRRPARRLQRASQHSRSEFACQLYVMEGGRREGGASIAHAVGGCGAVPGRQRQCGRRVSTASARRRHQPLLGLLRPVHKGGRPRWARAQHAWRCSEQRAGRIKAGFLGAGYCSPTHP